MIWNASLAGWLTIWAGYAWAAQDAAWIVSYGRATLLAILLPMTFLVFYDRWQTRNGLQSGGSTARH